MFIGNKLKSPCPCPCPCFSLERKIFFFVFATLHILVNITIIAFYSYFIGIGDNLKEWCEPFIDSLGVLHCRSVVMFLMISFTCFICVLSICKSLRLVFSFYVWERTLADLKDYVLVWG